MEDPVMLTSGQTFERSIIEQYYKIKEAAEATFREELDEDFDPKTYYVCPITMQSVGYPVKFLPNNRIKEATKDFL